MLSKIGVASRELINKMRDIVWSLNPGNETVLQWQSRMMAFAAMIFDPRNIAYDFSAEEKIKKMQLAPAQLKNIFLIYKEALNNIVKYADCKLVIINLSIQDNDFVMLIQDDGTGFNLPQPVAGQYNEEAKWAGGNGIKNMHARALDIRAVFSIHSKINEGTVVKLQVPLKKQQQETTEFGN